MYADFFLDRLCDAAPVLKLFKTGLEAIKDDWPEIDLAKDKLDVYATAKKFFDTLYHNFDDIELHYICHALYEQAGAKESIEYITKVCGADNLDISIEEQLLPTGRFYNIQVNFISTEYTNNLQLFKQNLENLVRDLLYYNNISLGLYSLTFECHVLNNGYLSEQVKCVNDKYALLPADIEQNELFIVRDLGE